MGRARILIAEDETLIAMNLEGILKGMGFDTAGIAYSGEQALELADERRPDLVLMDILFKGGMDGIEAATEIRKRWDIPVIYLTANADQATVERARQSEPFGYLNKPINEQDLYSNIDTALYKHGMEKRLRESRERYRSLIEEINDVVFSTDSEGILTYVSPPITAVSGHKPEEIVGRPFEDFIHPEDLSFVREEFERLEKGIIMPAEYRILSKEGTTLWVRSSSKPLMIQGRFQGLRGIITDISERKQAENLQALQRDLAVAMGAATGLEEALNLLLDAALKIDFVDSGGVYLVDPDTGSVDLKVHRGLSTSFIVQCTHYAADSPQAAIIRKGEPLHGSYPAIKPESNEVREREGIRCISVIPISHEGKRIAVLNLSSHTVEELPPATRNAIETIAAQTGNVLANLQVDRALREKTEELERFFNLALDLLCIADTGGNFRRLNREWETTLGYSLENLEGKRFFDFIHPDDMEATRKAVERLSAQNSVIDFVNRYRGSDGTYRWIEWRAIPSGDLIYAAARDVTERKEDRDRLQKQEEQLRFLLDNMIDIIFQIDAQNRFVYITPSVKKVLGFDPSFIIGRSILQVIHRDDIAGLTGAINGVIRSKNDSITVSCRVPHANGGYRWMETGARIFYDDAGKLTGAIAGSRDITDRRRLEDELMQFIKIIETTSDMIATATLDGAVTFMNRPGKHLAGWEDGETVIGKKIADVHPQWATKIIEEEGIPAALRDGLWTGETALLHAGGGEIPVSQIIMAHRSNAGNVDFLSTIMRDITPLKKNELAMRYSLKEKEVLLKEIHHRVKNNFQLIMSLLSLQSERSRNGEVRREIEESCGRIRAMAQMHENLYQSGDLARIDLASYLAKIARSIHSTLASPGGMVELVLSIEALSIGITQALPCGLIVNELISNSMKHSFPAEHRGERKIELGLRRDGNEVIITVADTGIGMEKVQALDQAESLGLTLVRVLTEQLGGAVHFISDGGTRFTLRFPIAE